MLTNGIASHSWITKNRLLTIAEWFIRGDTQLIIDKNNIAEEDLIQANKVLNKLRTGAKVFGNPGEGLKKSLAELDKPSVSTKKTSPTEFKLNDRRIYQQKAMLKAGIKGEEELAEHLEKIIKYNKALDGLIVFASLAYDTSGEDREVTIQDNGKGYICDTDFIAVYGNNILILDAKGLNTNPEIPIFLEGDMLKAMNKELFEIHSSNRIWHKFFAQNNIEVGSIKGYMVIVNSVGATIWKNKDWYESECPPIFIGDLEDFLVEWVESIGKSKVSLNLLTQITKTQIRKDSSGMQFSKEINKFKI